MLRFSLILTALAVILALAAIPSCALQILSPTPDQVVRENVKITVPESDLPPDFVIPKGEIAPEKLRPFVSVSVVTGGQEKLVAAISASAAVAKDGKVSFFWDSKAPFRETGVSDKNQEYHWKDGRYTLKIQLYDATGKAGESASVPIELKNKVSRRDQAVQLVNRMAFGESHSYAVHADVQVYHVVSGTYLPILGGMGMTSNFKIIQSVEDRRDDGSYMLRCKLDDGFVSSFGQKQELYPIGRPKPQLYRVVDRLGNVVNRNVFSRQAKFSIMDVLPVLPGRSVKEGDSWPTKLELKVEGITRVIPFTGTSVLDSFEWQNGHQCAKIVSDLIGSSTIYMDNGRVVSSSDKVKAKAITYFAFASGRMLRREVSLEFPATIKPGAGQLDGSSVAQSGPSSGGSQITSIATMYSDEAYGDAPPMTGPAGPPPGFGLGTPSGSTESSTTSSDALNKKGSVRIDLVVQLEK